MNDMQDTARRLFDIAEEHFFIHIPTPLDKKGYCDLFGEDPETIYQLKAGEHDISYHALYCYDDHISFSLDGEINCNLIPQGTGYLLQIINEDNEDAKDSFIEKHINTRDDLINAISGFQSVSSSQEADER